ncbi:N,N-dimethylformamidase beta subunit family domain-containing protein [Arthrobacter sp. NPDC056727]|uniref:N,N-dimethylformamidase beta subunit family domain-containing protein n=1 Tax=Arthrobacter sp. NPDC056727 TaxID=3345927 RepID=UPI00366C1EB7
MAEEHSAARRRIAVIALLAISLLSLDYPGLGGGTARPMGVAAASAAAASPPGVFDAARENRRPGTARSQVPTHWSSTAALEGFLGQNASVPRRRTVDLYISSTLGSIRIEAFRVGYYNGAGQRLVWTSGAVRVRRQRSCTVQRGTRMVWCRWAVTTRVNTAGWPEGLYYLILTGGSGRDHMIPLVVESASVTGKVVLVVNDCTMQAYNRWGGYSLYTGPGHRYSTRSYKVSFDRPYSNFTEIDERDSPLVRAAEAIREPGLRLAYTTESEISAKPSLATGAAAVIFSGHSEYWSPALRHNIEAARNHGTNVVFFGANNVYWRTRLEASFTGASRVEACYREAKLDPFRFSHPAAVTTEWRQGPVPDAEPTLTGAVYGDLRSRGVFTVTDPGFFAFAGTGAAKGATYPGLISGETDRVYPTARYPRLRHPANLHIFAHSPESGRYTRHGWADSTFYTTASGAGVLDMASIDWLLAQGEAAVPARSRAFDLHVTQNIIRAAGAGPLAGAMPRDSAQ